MNPAGQHARLVEIEQDLEALKLKMAEVVLEAPLEIQPARIFKCRCCSRPKKKKQKRKKQKQKKSKQKTRVINVN